MDKYIGRLLENRYEIIDILGVGGMAVVYKAKCHKLNRMVAIKVLKDDFLEDADFRGRFHAEGQAVAMLSHPNIVSVYDVSSTDTVDYIVMELIEGITLKQYIEKKGALNWKETLHFANQIAKALEHAHSRGIVHRDIKPHNIMVLRNGSVKVADFGIARGIAKGNTLKKEALGSVHYISPEQAKGEHVDARSDIYSLGVVMYEMATGKQPYEGSSPVNVALQHINSTPVLPTALNPKIPTGLEQIIMKAMAQNLEDRYSTAVELQQAIDQFLSDPTMIFPYPMVSIGKWRKSPGDRKRIDKSTDEDGDENMRKKPAELPEDRRKQRSGDTNGRKASKLEKIAIITCVAAIVIACVIMLLFMNGNPFTGGKKMVTVPDFVGRQFSSLPSYPGLAIALQEEVYDDFYEPGMIVSQDVAAKSSVPKGTTIYVTVSKGSAPKHYYMRDVAGKYQAEAQQILSQIGIRLTIKIEEVIDETVKAGKVIRTVPEKGAELLDGQEIVLYVAKAKTVEMQPVPGVVGKQVDIALTLLKANKFENIAVEYDPESTKPEGQVLSQSVSKGMNWDISKVITLRVAGVAPETEPPMEPEGETQPQGNG
ncbi:MAG: Stk1 family PASTA domain-containing Ser/Thr kinase [Ruminococcaceae bacterium]|nr:Stk1 family PASTA domain-containing Ser/Thr kinase [Oscillospiraceae bacterium]